MKFLVLSEREIKEYSVDCSHIIISIASPKANKPKIPYRKNCLDILYLEFYDLDGIYLDYKLFSPDQAKKLLNFVNTYKDAVDIIVCQCEAGISRSAGVAGALSKILNGEDFYIFNHYHPNMLVYRTILEEANK